MRLRKKSRAVSRQGKPALDPDAVELGKRLKAARKKKGIQQIDLAKRAGVSQITVFRNEKGEVHPELSTLRKYAGVLGVSVESLVGTEGMQAMQAKDLKPPIKTDSQDVPRNVARLLGIVPDITDDELTFLSQISRLDEGRTTEELQTMLLSMRVAKTPNEETIKAINDHLERRALDHGMRKVDIAPKPEKPEPKKKR